MNRIRPIEILLLVRFILMIVGALCCLSQVSSQNLIPNPSFEDLVTCPNDAGQFLVAKPWQGWLTPDIYHTCADSPIYGVPYNGQCNYLPAHDGNGYIGMWSYLETEMLYAGLLDTLEAGRYYYVRFYVATDDNCPGTAQTFSDGIGMAVRGGGQHGIYRIVAQNTGGVLRDTANWTRVSGCFQAIGNETFVQIGNFKSDDQTVLESSDLTFPLSQQSNYLFIDDLLLTPFDPFPDTVLMCNAQPVMLDASFYDAGIQWNTGDTTAILWATDPGTYTVIARIDGCTFLETVTVVNLDFDTYVQPDTSFCQGDEIMLVPGIQGEYIWSNGSTSSQLRVKESGIYEATIRNVCGEFNFWQKADTEDCRCRVFVPNAFSPNSDGINDLLKVFIGCDYQYEIIKIEVYNRWGGRVWGSQALLSGWDGKINGQTAAAGTYVWYLIYDVIDSGNRRQIVEKGEFNLLR